MRFYATFDVGSKLSKTEEGFLLCRDVVIARIGQQTYYAGEIPVTPDDNGIITITRDEKEVFDPAAIASFERKPITLTHPDGFVTADTWSYLAKGSVFNVRRGAGIESDCEMADLLVCDAEAIRGVESGDYRQVSCGYDAEYVETEPGKGLQKNIRGNHVALVQRARCGALCSIRDSEGGNNKMTKPWYSRYAALLPENIRSHFIDDAEEKEGKEEKKNLTEHPLDGLDARIAKAVDEAFEKREAKEKEAADKKAKDEAAEKEKEEEEKKKKEGEDCFGKSKDGITMAQEVMSRSFTLAPDFKRPTTDAMQSMTKDQFIDACCSIKRSSLTAAMKTADGAAAVKPFVYYYLNTGKSLDDCPCNVIDAAFIGASELLAHTSRKATSLKVNDFGASVTTAKLNQDNADFWSKRKPGLGGN